MIAPSKTFLASALAVLAAAGAVNGHGYMSDPAVKFTINGDVTQFIGTIEASASGLPGTFNGSPSSNAAAFTKAFDASEYKSLKELVTDKMTLISGATAECGLADPNATPQPLPEEYVEWAHSSNEGFTPSHEGPCEVWCDNTRVFKDDNCAAHYTSAPALLAYDRASCAGASRLTFYWLALHSSQWQVYINCAPLEKSEGAAPAASSAGSSPSNSTTTTSAPAPATPDAGSDDSDCGSLDVADDYDDDSDCGSLDLADDSDCGSLDLADDSDCGSLDLADSDDEVAGDYDDNTAPSTSPGTSPSTGTAPDDEVAGDADSTPVEDDSDCGSLDMADDSDCGSLDLADDDSDCGSLDLADDDSDCGSLDMADEEYSGTTAGLDFNSVDLTGSVAGKVEADA